MYSSASSSKRFTRSAAERQRKRSFETVIDPNEEKVQLCPIFKSEWIHHLMLHQDGWVKSVNNAYIQVQLFLSGSDSYLTNGTWLARSFGFKKPTNVKLYFKGLDNHFDMFVVRDEDQGVICISSDESDNVSMNSDGLDSESLYDEGGHDESFGNEDGNDDSDADDDEFGFENVGPLSWELNVTRVVASVRKMQVGRIPKKIANGMLLHRDMIYMRTPYTNEIICCEIKTSERSMKLDRKEKYFTDGWYRFVRNYQPNVGDIVKFNLTDPPDVVHLEIKRC